jgi:hypothetical protein
MFRTLFLCTVLFSKLNSKCALYCTQNVLCNLYETYWLSSDMVMFQILYVTFC